MTDHTWITGRGGRWIMAFALLAVGPGAVAAQDAPPDVRQYLREGQELARVGRFEEALEHYIWFREHALTYQPAMVGVRNSFALMYWRNLGEVYPPARAAMVDELNATLDEFRENPENARLFSDVQALHRYLYQEHKTLEFFELLANERPDAAQAAWRFVSPLAIESRRFDLLRRFGVDLQQMFEGQVNSYTRLASSGPPELVTTMQATRDRNFVSTTLTMIEAALALEQPETARAIQTRAYAVVPSPLIAAAIP
jgi:hypothetical protein